MCPSEAATSCSLYYIVITCCYCSQSINRMKAHFDYNPKTDQHLPCPEAGLAFNRGAILFILNQEDDPDWWQVNKFCNIFPWLQGFIKHNYKLKMLHF